MAQSWTFAHQQFCNQLRVVCSQALTLNKQITDLANYYNSPAVQGSAMTDAEIQGFGNLFLELTAAKVNQGMTDLEAIQTAITSAMQQRLSEIICGTPTQ